VEGLWLGRRLDLGRASAEALAVVPGIGPRLGARIVADREARGPFGSVADVERVKGIGPKLRARLARYARIGPSAAGERAGRDGAQP
jgi:competence protein ComEA